MSYEPTNWKTGDVVTSAKLNKLENGVANSGGLLVLHEVDEVLDKTFDEIVSAAENNAVMIIGISDASITYGFVTKIVNNSLEIKANFDGNTDIYIATSRESYPALS